MSCYLDVSQNFVSYELYLIFIKNYIKNYIALTVEHVKTNFSSFSTWRLKRKIDDFVD